MHLLQGVDPQLTLHWYIYALISYVERHIYTSGFRLGRWNYFKLSEHIEIRNGLLSVTFYSNKSWGVGGCFFVKILQFIVVFQESP